MVVVPCKYTFDFSSCISYVIHTCFFQDLFCGFKWWKEGKIVKWWRTMVCVFNTCKLCNQFLIKRLFPSFTDISIILCKHVHVPAAIPYCVREKQDCFTLGPFHNKNILSCNMLILAAMADILISGSGTVRHVSSIHHITLLLRGSQVTAMKSFRLLPL